MRWVIGCCLVMMIVNHIANLLLRPMGKGEVVFLMIFMMTAVIGLLGLIFGWGI